MKMNFPNFEKRRSHQSFWKYSHSSRVSRNLGNSTRGQSIIEVVIAIGIVSLVMTALVSLVAVSVKNAGEAKAKAVATQYTQDALEFFRQERILLGWDTFLQTVQNRGSSVTYCLDILPATPTAFAALPSAACNSTQFVDSKQLFQRQATAVIATVGGKKQMTVTVTVTWQDGAMNRQSSAVIVFNGWNAAIPSAVPIGNWTAPTPTPIPVTGYWKFDEGSGSNVADSSGNGNNGTWFGSGSHWTTGLSATAGLFNGTDDAVVSNASIGNFGISNFTIEFWLKTTNVGTQFLFTKQGTCGPDSYWYIRTTGGVPRMEVDQNVLGTNLAAVNGTTAVNDGVWHHLAFVRSGTSLMIYVDGALNATQATTGVANISNTTAFKMASSPCAGRFSGTLEEAKVYTVALSASQIQADFRAF